MADQQFLLVCVAARQAVHFIGMPEEAIQAWLSRRRRSGSDQ